SVNHVTNPKMYTLSLHDALPILENDVVLQKSPEKPEIGVARHRQPQYAIPVNQPAMRPDIRESVGAEFLRRVRGGNASDGQRPNQAHHGTAQEDQAGNGLAAAERVRHDS